VLLSVLNNNNNNKNKNSNISSSNMRLNSYYETIIINFATTTTLLAIVPILSCLAG